MSQATPMKMIRTTLISANFRQFGLVIRLFDIAAQINNEHA